MADRMDELLDSIGKEANASIDFEAAFAEVLAKAQAQELAQANQKGPRRWAWAKARYLSMAAGMVVILGAAVLLGRGGLKKEFGAGAAESAEPQLAMSSESAAPAEAPAAPAPAAFAMPITPGGGEGDTGSAQGDVRIAGDVFYGSTAITVPAAGSACAETPKASADVQAQREESLLNGSHDAYDAEGGICMIGETTRLAAQEKLAELGYTACFSTDAHVDQLAMLLPGEACIANSGEIGVWNTGDGFLTLSNPALSQMEIYDLLLSAV